MQNFRGNTIVIEGLAKEGYGQTNANESNKLNETYNGINEQQLDLDDPNFVSCHQRTIEKQKTEDLQNERAAQLKKVNSRDQEDLNKFLIISYVLEGGGVGQVRLDLSVPHSSDYQFRDIGVNCDEVNEDWLSMSSGTGGRDKDKRLKNLKRSQSKNHLFYTKGESYVVIDVRERKSRSVSRSRSRGKKRWRD